MPNAEEARRFVAALNEANQPISYRPVHGIDTLRTAAKTSSDAAQLHT